MMKHIEDSHNRIRDLLNITLQMDHKAGRRKFIDLILAALEAEEQMVRRLWEEKEITPPPHSP